MFNSRFWTTQSGQPSRHSPGHGTEGNNQMVLKSEKLVNILLESYWQNIHTIKRLDFRPLGKGRTILLSTRADIRTWLPFIDIFRLFKNHFAGVFF